MHSTIVDSVESLTYSLVRHVPDMQRGFTIHTNYGDINILAEDSKPFVIALERLLQKKIRQIQKGQAS